MKKRQLGNSSLYVSEIGFGCMSLPTDIRQTEKIIHSAIESGITFFDTADLYDFGLNESLLGSIIKPYRKDIVLATKVGNRFSPGKESWEWDASYSYIKKAVKNSLQRLQTDVIDLYQLHGGTIDDPTEETIAAFDDLVKEGYIRNYGISSIRPNVISRFLEKSSIVSIMMPYNLLDRRAEELFPLLKKHNVSIIARGPLAKGLLTTKTVTNRNSNHFIKGYESYTGEELHTILTSLHNRFSPLGSAAIRFCLANDTVASTIPGASNVNQVSQNSKAADFALSEADLQWMYENTKTAIFQNHR